jgi:transposase
MITPEQIANIRRLFHAEHWKVGTIAAELGLHPDTVKRALRTDSFTQARSLIARPSDPFLELIVSTLKQHPRLRATRLFEMLRDRGYQGSISQLRRVIKRLRPPSGEAFLRLSVLPGEHAQVDWASFGLITVGRAKRRLSCFVLTLSYSRAFYFEFFFDQTLENFFQGHVNAFADLGGVVRTCLYDNLKAVVLERHGEAVRFHPRLLELCGHYHFAARPCRPARGNEKGRVERTIRYLRDSFFAARPFTSLPRLNREALEWRDRVALARRWPSDSSLTVAEAFAQERSRLLPLPAHPFECELIKTVRSDKTIYIRFDLNNYSIPHSYVRRPLTLAASASTVRLLDGPREVARHPRCYDREQRIDDPAHLAALLEEKRQALGATAVGRLQQSVPSIAQFLDAAFQRGESVAHQTSRLLELLDDYGARDLSAAVAEALARQTPRADSVAFILNRRRRAPQQLLLPVDLSRHPHLADLSVPTHHLEVYDELSPNDDPSDDDPNR